MKNTILFWLTVATLTILVNSCGARKAESEKKLSQTKTDFSGLFRTSGNSSEILNSDLKINNLTLSNVDDHNVTETVETTVKPDDPTKPSSYIDPTGKKHILDNAILTNKTTTQKNNTKSEKFEKSEKVVKSQEAKKAENKASGKIKIKAKGKKAVATKKTNRQAWSLWNLLWLLIPATLIAVFIWIRKKYKQVNPLA